MKKLIRFTTIADSFDYFKGQLNFLSNYNEIIVVGGGKEELYCIEDRGRRTFWEI